ncbi:hypothetical protein DSM112329_02772 [Paraconexibacter sp. AEG42_29]|uniref:Uncharacterized protein n=1 Tax=Paraconexibacter sp. AEG42_29 TaxID=2997339 RepID=A0AAU7AW79_9ACTN
MLALVLHNLRPPRPRRLLVPLLLLVVCGLAAIAGAIVGDPMLSGGGLGVLSAALPPSLLYAYASEPPEDDGGGGDGPGGNRPNDPSGPDGRGGDDGLDWGAFDTQRREWERTPIGA